MNMDMTVYASRRKISSTYLAGKYLYIKKKYWNASGEEGYISVLLRIDDFFPVCGLELSVHTILKRII